MSYVLAIDVGTSFTAAAIARIDLIAPSVPESLPLGLRGTSVPSVLYYPEEGPILVGEAAERRGLDSPDRVVREFKRRIGDDVPIAVGALSLPAEEVFATMAGWVVDRAAEREGEPPSQIILSHPAAWGGHRTAVLQEALSARGLHGIALITEPEAAALHYASQTRVEDGSTIAVYDLGGGTFDSALLTKARTDRFEFLGRPVGIEGLGGTDFDAAVLRHVAAHTGEAFAALDPADPASLASLARIRRECVEAKEALSADSVASISVFLPGIHQQVRLVRSELEAMIEEPIRQTVDALERSLDELGLEADDLTAVLLIGGSSRIPLVAQLISEQLDRPIAVDADPKSSICLGAAVAAVRARQVAAAAAALPAETGTAVGTDPSSTTAMTLTALTNDEPHGDSRRASWSRNSGPAGGSLAGTAAAAAGVGARGHAGTHAGAHGPAASSGPHSPRPSVRLTAVAAAAALFTVLTATAAQSPEGLGSLTSMFAPQEANSAAADPGTPAPGGTSQGGVEGNGAGATGGGQAPRRGIEASAKKATDKSASPQGIEAAASPTSKPSTGASTPLLDGGGTAGAAAGSVTGATAGTTSDPTQGTSGSGAAAGTTPTTNPGLSTDPIPNPTTDPPVPDPTTEPPAPVPDPTTEPPAPAPDPTVEPPAPAPDPIPTEPDPTEPDPTTEPPAEDPIPTEPAV